MPVIHIMPSYRSGVSSLAAGLLFAIATSLAVAADWPAAEQQLAAKVITVTGLGAINLEVVNRSSLSQKEFEDIARGLRSEFTGRGAQLVRPEQAAATVKVSLSENLQNYLWVAEMHQGADAAVTMVSLARPDTVIYMHAAAPLSLRKISLWSQKERILDIISLDVNGTPVYLAVLAPEQLHIYKYQDGRYQEEQVLAIEHEHPWPRDLRGRLLLSKDHLLDVYLPGTFCQSTAALPLALKCHASDDPWPLVSDNSGQSAFFSATRNFFTGVLSPGVGKKESTVPFYSAAALPRDGYMLWLFSGTDRQTHLVDGVNDQLANYGWGSGLVSVKTGCGSGWQLLSTSTGAGGHDSVRAFEFSDRDPIATGQPIEFAGEITALWPEPGGATAMAVSRNPETGQYEAFRLQIACSQ